MHIHEIEERKNLHINDLMRNHEKAFGQMKSYYNDITNDNLKLIKSLKDEVTEMKKKAIANQKLMHDISQENHRLKEPLTIAVAEVADLRSQLKDREKDRLSLRNAKARLNVLESQLGTLRGEHAGTAAEYSSIEKERDELFNSFESSVKQVQQKTDFRNIVLDQKLGNMASSLENAEVQVKQIVAAANLDPIEAERVQASLDSTLSARNQQIKDLRFALVRVTKSYNDSLRSFMQKLEDLGIPTTEVDAMGFVPIPTSASMGPAGLVVR